MSKTETISGNPETGTLTELQQVVNRLESQLLEMKKLSTTQGFFNVYFEQLKNCLTQTEAFNVVNEQYYRLFGQYRFSSFTVYQQRVSCYGS